MATPLTNSFIDKFDEKLKIYDSIFFKTVTAHGGLLSELATIKSDSSLPTEAEYGADGATNYSTDQFAKFIKNIVNFDIKNFDQFNSATTYKNLTFVKNTAAAGVTPVYNFNDKITKNIIETLKVINVFVDILEAYKFCIENDTASGENPPLIPATGYTADINIDSIELVSDTTRFYHNSIMYPLKSTHKNVGYIRIVNKDSDNTVKSTRTVLFLSIESFYTGMQQAQYNYDNCFHKTKINTSGSIENVISTDIFTAGARISPATPITLDKLTYARQVYSGRASDDAAALTNISLDDRNKALVKSLLKMLFNLEPKYRKPNVLALYYYYKFVQLYSTLIINVSNVMYANVELAANPKRIETRNMSTQKNKRSVSGIQVTTAGVGYGTTPRTVSATAPTGGGNGVSATLSLDGTTIPLNTVVNITDGGTLYDSAPSTITLVGDPPASSGSGASAVTAVAAVLKGTVIPIAIKDDGLISQEKNLDKLRDVINEISNSLSEIMNELSKTVTIENVITTASGYSPASVSYSADADKRVVIKITNPAIYNILNNLNIKNDLVSDYIIYDKISSYYYTILKVIDNGNNDFEIKLNAMFETADLPTTQDELSLDAKVFKNASNGFISPLPTVGPTTIPSPAPYLIITKKDINAYKSEYVYNRATVELLDANIKFNTTKIEHHIKLYETQYNKNVFLNRQILSYNIIIGAIILMLVIINLFNVEKQLVKTISLASLGALLLLFAIYFISNITYIETFVVGATPMSTSHMLYRASAEYITAEKGKANPRSNTDIYAEKPKILTDEINKLNSKFIGYFEKIIIALPSSDSTDFYSEIKDVITNDKDKKKYIDQMLEIKKVQGTNDMDTIKYEIEQSKLYIMVLLVASIVFITLYNIYINYISNDKYLSLMLFICGIILIIIVSYYIINSNRRVRTVYKNIYWGPEHSANF
jgi:hypothetical protein